MRVTLDIRGQQLNQFYANCEAIISKVGNGSRKALIESLNIISENSLNQVPRDTETLALSHFWEVTGDYKVGWTGKIGYGGNGDPINPKTGKPASSYMVAVHEDLYAFHVRGNAKFLEGPIRDFARERFPRTVIKHVQAAINTNGRS